MCLRQKLAHARRTRMCYFVNHREVDDYVCANRHQRSMEPSLSATKGYQCVNGRGSYLLEEIVEVTEALDQGVSGATPHSIAVGAH